MGKQFLVASNKWRVTSGLHWRVADSLWSVAATETQGRFAVRGSRFAAAKAQVIADWVPNQVWDDKSTQRLSAIGYRLTASAGGAR